jgi:hypothetical protein
VAFSNVAMTGNPDGGGGGEDSAAPLSGEICDGASGPQLVAALLRSVYPATSDAILLIGDRTGVPARTTSSPASA